MLGVETIWRPTEEVLVVGRSVWLRLIGATLAALTSGLIAALIPLRPNILGVMVLSLLVLLGLHIALSHASVTFRTCSHVCVVRRSVFGFLPWDRVLKFSDVRVRRQSNWGSETAWLYRISLTPQDPGERPIRLGHMTNRTRCEALAQTIAQFTDTVALDRNGQTLPESEPARSAPKDILNV